MSEQEGDTKTDDRKIKDLFGFKRSSDYVLDEKKNHLSKYNVTNSRDLEWVQYLKAIGGVENLKPGGIFEPSSDLKSLVRRGIPVAYRALVWSRISLAAIYKSNYPATYFSSLLSRSSEVNKKAVSDIEKDVERTFPGHEYFGMEIGIDSLRKVLLAFALHNPEVGYCQSLNFIVGMMLLFMEEEDAFWLLATIVTNLLPPDYYTRSMVGTYTDQVVLTNLIRMCLPSVYKKLAEASHVDPRVADSVDLETDPVTASVTLQWFLCLFVNTLRPEVTLRIWDIFFNEGDKVLFKIALALFKQVERKLMEATDWGTLLGIIRNIGNDIVDADALISLAYRNHSTTQPTKVSNNTGNPRLRTHSESGKVPLSLTGIGIAHVGPNDTTIHSGSIVTCGDGDSASDSRPTSANMGDVKRRSNSFSNDGIFKFNTPMKPLSREGSTASPSSVSSDDVEINKLLIVGNARPVSMDAAIAAALQKKTPDKSSGEKIRRRSSLDGLQSPAPYPAPPSSNSTISKHDTFKGISNNFGSRLFSKKRSEDKLKKTTAGSLRDLKDLRNALTSKTLNDSGKSYGIKSVFVKSTSSTKNRRRSSIRFSSADIDSLRLKYRPFLEERFSRMDLARTQSSCDDTKTKLADNKKKNSSNNIEGQSSLSKIFEKAVGDNDNTDNKRDNHNTTMSASYDELVEKIKALESEKIDNLARIEELATEVVRVNRKSKDNLLLMNKTLLELKMQYDEGLLSLKKENDKLVEVNHMLKSSLQFPYLLRKGYDAIDGVESADNTPINVNDAKQRRGRSKQDENKNDTNINGNCSASNGKLLSSPIHSIDIDEHFDFPDASPATLKALGDIKSWISSYQPSNN